MRYILLAALFGSFCPPLLACPLGKGEAQLTVQRVMRNFGRFTLKADKNALRGKNPFDHVSSNEIRDSIADLDLAISCAEAVLAAPTGLKLPTCTQSLSGKMYDDYVSLYLQLMRDYSAGLREYQQIFKDILDRPENNRSFDAAYNYSKELEKLVDAAHKSLFGN